jgi:hypothetical protein
LVATSDFQKESTDMARQAAPAGARDGYSRKTELRMKALTEELEALVLTQTGRTDELWRQLREQEEASRQAGFAGIARLCRQMQLCLKEAQESGSTQSAAAAGWLLGVCQAIQAHARDAEKRMRRVDRGNECGKGRPIAGSEAAPHAVFSTPNAPGDCCLVQAD